MADLNLPQRNTNITENKMADLELSLAKSDKRNGNPPSYDETMKIGTKVAVENEKKNDNLAPLASTDEVSILSSAALTTPRSSTNSTLTLDETVNNNVNPKDSSLSNGLIHRKNGTNTVVENPTYEVTFAVDDDDSIISSKSSLCIPEKQAKLPIPDGGWGWVVVLSSLVISMVADGISFSFGLLYIEFLDYFGESKSKTAWIGSLFMAVPLLSGPVMSTLVDRYGCRTMTILGGIISGLGFVLASISNSIGMLYLTFGVIAGLGLGMCYVTAVVSIAYWFDKKRNLAVGLGACGTGIGTFVYAPMTQYFINEYAWRGTTLLLAGTFLNMCVCGAVMRDPEWWIQEQNKQAALNGRDSKSMRGASSCGSISGRSGADAESVFPGVEEIRKLLKSGQTPEYILTTLVTSLNTQQNETKANDLNPSALGTSQSEIEKLEPKHSSVVNLPTFLKQSEKVPFEVLEALSSNKKLYNVILENYPSLLLCRSYSENKLNCVDKNVADQNTCRVPVTMSMRLKQTKKPKEEKPKEILPPISVISSPTESVKDTKDPKEPLLPRNNTDSKIQIVRKSPTKKILGNPPTRSDSLPWLKRQFSMSAQSPHYLKNIRVHRNSVMYRGAMLNIHKYRLRASSCPDIYRNSMTTIARENEEKWYEDALDLFKTMFDFSLFLEFHFLLLSLSTILLFTWFIVPYFYLADHMKQTGFEEQDAANLLSIIGITNTIGMIALGWAGDQPWMSVSKTYATCLVACGISTVLFPLLTPYGLIPMSINAAFFGLFFSSTFSFTPVLLVELIPLENFTISYGLILLCQGIGNLVGPPLAGLMFDITEYWDLSFYSAGVWIVVSGILIAIIPMTKNRRLYGSAPLEKDLERDRDSGSYA